MATQKKARRYGSSNIWADADERDDSKNSAPRLGSPSPSTATPAPRSSGASNILAGVNKDDAVDAILGLGSFASGKGFGDLFAPKAKGISKVSTPVTPARSRGGSIPSKSGNWFEQLLKSVNGVTDSFNPKPTAGGIAGRIGNLVKQSTRGLAGQDMGGDLASSPEFGKTLAQYLAEAGDGSQLMGQQNAMFDARQNELTKRAGVSDSALQALYAQLGNSMGQAAERESARYDEQANVAAARTEATQGNIAAARSSASDAEAAIAKNLGLGDRSKSISSQQAKVDGAMAQGATAARGLSQQELMQSMGAAQNDYFRGNEAAAGFRGAEQRANMQSELQSRLAAIQEDRTMAQTNAASEARALAAQMYAADYGQFNDQRAYQDNRDQTAYDRSWQQTQAQNEMRLGQQQIQAEQEARMSEAAAQYAAEQEKRTPAYARIQQQLTMAMPPERAAVAMEEIARAKLQGKNPESQLSNLLTPQELRIALQAANEYAAEYK